MNTAMSYGVTVVVSALLSIAEVQAAPTTFEVVSPTDTVLEETEHLENGRPAADAVEGHHKRKKITVQLRETFGTIFMAPGQEASVMQAG